MNYLNENEQSVFILRNFDSLRYKQIAAALQITERNVKRLMRSALKKVIYYVYREEEADSQAAAERLSEKKSGASSKKRSNLGAFSYKKRSSDSIAGRKD